MENCNCKIMIVDTKKDFVESITPKLEEHGFQVCFAESYNEALRKYKEVQPHMVLSALMLEHYDSGFVLAHKLKKENPDLLFYILSSVTNNTGIKFSLNSEEERKWISANGFLNEPIKPEDLVELMQAGLTRKDQSYSLEN